VSDTGREAGTGEGDAGVSWPVGDPVAAPPVWPYPEQACDWEALFARPVVAGSAWVAPGAVLVGRVRIGERASVWYGCVLRGDDAYIEVGAESNVQDGSVLHVDPGWPCVLGERVTVGHRAVVHACRVGDGALIGIGAVVLSRCTIGAGALIAAGAVVLEGTDVPPGTLWAGCPARQVRELSPDQSARLVRNAQRYVNRTSAYRARGIGDASS
jgi:carbonic anhydrase/acetyltransferase-like protein (isoleucine patch superfamily)